MDRYGVGVGLLYLDRGNVVYKKPKGTRQVGFSQLHLCAVDPHFMLSMMAGS